MSKKPSSTRSDMDGDPQAQAKGKVANDRNQGSTATQIHQSQRSPASRSDRESQIGANNQVRSRTTRGL